MLTAPAALAPPSASPGDPTARSKKSSSLKRPLAIVLPKPSPWSAVPPTPLLPWTKTSALGTSPPGDP
jgi:hypothetical protein